MKCSHLISFDACTKRSLLVLPCVMRSKGNKDLGLPPGVRGTTLKVCESFLMQLPQQLSHLESQTLFVSSGKQELLVVLIGWCPEEGSLGERYDQRMRFAHQVYRVAKQYGAKQVAICLHPGQFSETVDFKSFIEGVALSSYQFTRYQAAPSKSFLPQDIGFFCTEDLPLLPQAAEVKRLMTVVDAVAVARDLVNTTSNDCTPKDLVAHARNLARELNLSCKVYDEAGLAKLGAHAVLAVGQGSENESYLVKLVYRPRNVVKTAPVISLVGKGVTFDSGGLSIKPTDSMKEMKFDMGGAATVLATIEAAARLKIPVEVRVYVPLVENMINGASMRPGDVIQTLAGKTVEVLNTDAEGRLILADALTLAEQEGGDLIIDVATLTGAVVVALGAGYAGFFTADETLAAKFSHITATTDERFWRLPLPQDYRKMLKSNIADLKNIGGRWGGAITAALFLKEFVKTSSWVHLDIAGVVWEDSGDAYKPFGGTGFGVRSLVEIISSYAS
jgi:leucyl aminopeptidase